MSKPVVIDLCCGRFGWGRAFAQEGYDVVGFDLEHDDAIHGPVPDGCHLILKDIREINGHDLRAAVNPALIVASPPCQEYSYMAMPWTLAKQMAAWYREDPRRIGGIWPNELRTRVLTAECNSTCPTAMDASTAIKPFARNASHGSKTDTCADPAPDLLLNELFNACFRIARECGVPIVLENVKGAQPWVGQAAWHYGSYYLWGDVPALMPTTLRGCRASADAESSTAESTDSTLTTASALRSKNGTAILTALAGQEEIKQPISGHRWFDDGLAHFGSKSSARKAASAMIAEIPFDLAQHIARCFKPREGG